MGITRLFNLRNKQQISVSDDGSKILYLSKHGELGNLYCFGINNEHELVARNVFNFTWNYDGSIVFTSLDKRLISDKVYVYRFNGGISTILQVRDGFLDIARSSDKKHCIISCSKTQNEATDIYVARDKIDHIYKNNSFVTADVYGNLIYSLSNIDGYKKLYKTEFPPKAFLGSFSEHCIYDPGPNTQIENVMFLKDACIIHQRNKSVEELLVLKNEMLSKIKLPFDHVSISLDNESQDCSNIKVSVSSPLIIQALLNINLETLDVDIEDVATPYGFDHEKYTTKTEYVGKDEIPITLIHKKGISRNGRNKCILVGYGAYGEALMPYFRVEYLPLLEKGFIICHAHTSECGTRWHVEGRGSNKVNSFTDFINVAEYLVESGYAHPKKLAAFGTSAGGLLVAACLNMRPDLFKLAVLRVPFLDPLGTMMDDQKPLHSSETIEWGDVINDMNAYNTVRSYSPLQNLVKTSTKMLIISAKDDERIDNADLVKYVALKKKLGDHVIMKYYDRGHVPDEPVFDEYAFEIEFILENIN